MCAFQNPHNTVIHFDLFHFLKNDNYVRELVGTESKVTHSEAAILWLESTVSSDSFGQKEQKPIASSLG